MSAEQARTFLADRPPLQPSDVLNGLEEVVVLELTA
jgi:hypothetical protein